MDQRFLTTHQRVVRGSLPLKKRRLVLQESQCSSSFHHAADDNDAFRVQRHNNHNGAMTTLYNASTLEGKKPASFHHSGQHAPFALLPEHTMTLSTSVSSSPGGGSGGLDSKIAALALVAAAASYSSSDSYSSQDENKIVRLNSFRNGCGGGGAPFLPMLNGHEEESRNQYSKDSAFASLLSATLSSKTDTPKCYPSSERALYESHINIDGDEEDDKDDEEDEDNHGEEQDKRQVASASMRTCAPSHLRPTVATAHSNGNKRSKLTLNLKQKRSNPSVDMDDRTVSSSSGSLSSPPALVSPQPRRKVIKTTKTTTTTTQANHSSSAAVTGGATTLQQDKRYTGAADEVRCHATTTRGRPCSYIAVKGTSYCHLHADYDANPPPRRGGQNQKGGTQVSKQGASRMPSPSPLSPIPKTSTLPAPPCAEVSITSPPSVSSEESTARLSSSPLPSEANTTTTSTHKTAAIVKKKTGRRTSSKLAELHAESPRPLLSMIATEEWFGKRVHIASGPMADRQGTVEKWGNGWISVRIPGVGLHNRRSFELYLVDDEEHDATAKGQHTGETGGEDRSVQGDDAAIARCVSSDAMSPMRMDDDWTNHPTKSKKSPPKLTLHIGSVENKSRRTTASPIPETPRVADSKTGMTTDDVPMLTQTCTKDSEDEAFEDVPKVTPDSPPKRTVESARLEDEVSAASSNKKHKYDMLFGTAALDRGRRLISKPTRYEATPSKSSQHHDKRPKKPGDAAALVASDVSVKSSKSS